MSRKIKTAKTAQQRKAEAESMHASIATQVEELRAEGTWNQFLAFTAAFHNYSLNNLLLILSQNPAATQVAGYRTWQKLGRQVRKGERGIRIFGGREVVTTEEDEQTGEEKQIRRRRFFPVSVFDIGQTDPINPQASDPSTLARPVTGEDEAGILQAVTEYLAEQGWSLERTPVPGRANGYTKVDGSRLVVIDEDLEPAQAARTALHEAAHVHLHSDQDFSDYVAHRGTQETEAESVAYVLAALAGLDTSAYSIGYVAGWSEADPDLIRSTAANVLQTVHALAGAMFEEVAAVA